MVRVISLFFMFLISINNAFAEENIAQDKTAGSDQNREINITRIDTYSNSIMTNITLPPGFCL